MISFRGLRVPQVRLVNLGLGFSSHHQPPTTDFRRLAPSTVDWRLSADFEVCP
jgi:hypothetical protein